MSSRQVAYRLMATGSTDAVGKAKQTARAEGRRIQTVASVRPEIEPGEATSGRMLATTPHLWVVVLAVRE